MTRLNLAILLEHDAKGNRYGKTSRLEEVIEEYKTILDKIDPTSPQFNNLPITLMKAGQFEELKEFVKKHGPSPTLNALKLVAIAATEGSEAAINEARKSLPGEETRPDLLQSAGTMLVQIRRYPEAAALLTAGARGDPNSAEILARAAMIGKIKRREETPALGHDPRATVARLLSAMFLEEDTQELLGLFAREARMSGTETELKDLQKMRHTLLAQLRKQNIAPDFIADMMLPMIQMSGEGEDSFGHRIRTQIAAPTVNRNDAFFLVLEDGEYRILGGGSDSAEVGMLALRLGSNGDIAAARRWLDWAREETPLTGGDDPLAGPPFPRFWTKGSDAGLEQIRYAAASLMATAKVIGEQALPILLEGREKASDDEVHVNFDLALAAAYSKLEQYQELLPVAKRLLQVKPTSESAFAELILALGRLDRLDEVEKASKERLGRLPDDPPALRTIRNVEGLRGNFEEANKITNRLREMGRANAGDLNSLAWNSLMAGQVTEKAVEAGQRAAMLSQNQDAAILHTLASLYAELGRTNEGRELILRTMEVGGMEEPEPQV